MSGEVGVGLFGQEHGILKYNLKVFKPCQGGQAIGHHVGGIKPGKGYIIKVKIDKVRGG